MEFISGLAQLETEMTGVRQIIYFLLAKNIQMNFICKGTGGLVLPILAMRGLGYGSTQTRDWCNFSLPRAFEPTNLLVKDCLTCQLSFKQVVQDEFWDVGSPHNSSANVLDCAKLTLLENNQLVWRDSACG